MQFVTTNGEKVYNLTVGKTLPEWLTESKQSALKKNAEFRSRVELIQDLHFPISCQRLRFSQDGEFLFAAALGVYPPRVKCFELKELSMKFERRLDAPAIQFLPLTEDYTKMVFLRTDRYLEFHAQFGTYFKIRVPKSGRDIMYDYASCDLLTVGATSEIYRLNLEKGTFLKPLQSSCPSINACHINPYHGLYGVGGSDGIAEFWDPRTRKATGFLDVAQQVEELAEGGVESRPEITTFRFHNNGLTFAVGTSSGHCMLYDLRSSAPQKIYDHRYGLPITDIKFNDSTNHIITSCKKITKIWDLQKNPSPAPSLPVGEDGEKLLKFTGDSSDLFISIEPPCEISEVAVQPNSGILMIAGEQKKINVYYIPALGTAPKWCSFLDNITEGLEAEDLRAKEDGGRVYQDYKFLTREELEKMGVENLIGTDYLRAYMHGYFIDIRLYNKIRSMANPDEYKEWRKEQIKSKLDAKRASRITVVKNLPPVNKDLAKKIVTAEPEKSELLTGRFSRMFNDPAFAIDTGSEAYKRVKPVLSKQELQAQHEESDDENLEEEDNQMDVEGGIEGLEEIQEGEGEGEGEREREREREEEEEADSDEEQQQDTRNRHMNEDESYLEKMTEYVSAQKQQQQPSRKRKIRFFEAKSSDKNELIDTQKIGNFGDNEKEKRRKLEGASFEKRVVFMAENDTHKNKDKIEIMPFGPRSLTFVPEAEGEAPRATKHERKVRNKTRRSMKNVPKRPARQR